jgi:hypothetical protein
MPLAVFDTRRERVSAAQGLIATETLGLLPLTVILATGSTSHETSSDANQQQAL